MKAAKTRAVSIFCTWLTLTAFSIRATDSSKESALSRPLRLPAHFDGVLIYVEAQIGGEKGLNLVLDTGASVLTISPELAERLRKGGSVRDKADERVETASSQQPELHFVELTDVRLGEFAVARCEAAVADMTSLSKAADEPQDGIAGMALFASKTLVLDFPQKQVRVETTGVRHTNSIVVPCDYRANRPFISMELANGRLDMMVDSGASGGFFVPWKARWPPLVSPPVIVTLAVNFSDTTELKCARLATNVVWGGITFERPVVAVSQQDSGLVGMEVLKYFTVGFDQRNNLLWLVAATNSPITSPPVRSFGLSLDPSERGFKVLAVIPMTDAWEAGIFPGDYVTTINGEPAKQWNRKRLSALKDNAEKAEIDVVRREKTRRLQLRITTLVE